MFVSDLVSQKHKKHFTCTIAIQRETRRAKDSDNILLDFYYILNTSILQGTAKTSHKHELSRIELNE